MNEPIKEVAIHALTPSETLYNAFIEVFGDNAGIMWEVARCESNRQQFNGDGTVKIGVTGDRGIMQIAPQFWLEEAKRLNYDIDTTIGNLRMANHILSVQGINAWSASYHCHKVSDTL